MESRNIFVCSIHRVGIDSYAIYRAGIDLYAV
jgi:hypothetical protein